MSLIQKLCKIFVFVLILFAFGCTQGKNENLAQGDYKIGFIGPLTGNSAWYGERQLEAVGFAAEEINAAGGINGKKLVVLPEDDKCVGKDATTAMKKLAEIDKVPVVLGAWCSSASLAMAPIAEQTKTVMISESANDKLRTAGEYIFRNKPGALMEAGFVVPATEKIFKYKSAGILYINNDYGIAIKDEWKKQLEQLEIEVAVIEAFEQGASEFKTQLLKIKTAKPDVVFLVGYAKEDGLILKETKELGMELQFISTLTTENPDVVKIAENAADGIVYTYLYDPFSSRPQTKAYQEKYKAKFGHDSEMWGALYHDSLWLLKPIFEKCANDSTCIKDSLYKVQGYEGVVGTYSFDSYGDAVMPFILKTIKNGEFMKFEAG